MADNYLEKRYEEVFGSNGSKSSRIGTHRHTSLSLDSLLLKNRSYRGYNQEYEVSEEQLEKIVEVCTKIPSARNQQVLRFKLITKKSKLTNCCESSNATSSVLKANPIDIEATSDSGSSAVSAILNNIKLGGALPELHLPYKGTEPQAFIIVCSTAEETKMIDIDLGIAAQSMLLKAVELGLNGIMILAFNRDEIRKTLNLPYEPLMVIAIGKGSETIQLLRIKSEENHNYFRKEGIHYVPKISPDELIIR